MSVIRTSLLAGAVIEWQSIALVAGLHRERVQQAYCHRGIATVA